MKNFLQCFVSLCLTFALFIPAFAQITITASDVSAALAVGTSFPSRSDTVTRTANIGTTGATSWNFSELVTNFTSTSTSVRPDTTPFYSNFPGSTHAQKVGAIYAYYTLGTDLVFNGTAFSTPFETRTKLVPGEILDKLPMTLGTTWTSTYVESTYVTLPPPLPPQVVVSNQTVNYTVDAYGNLTLPGGGVYSALRLKSDRRTVVSGNTIRTISYIFTAKNGASVSGVAADTLQPNSGTINVSSMSWNGPLGTTDVQRSDALPTDFALMQNYPNPFNPSTTIEFDLPHSSFVRLVVVNVLGMEVATLVNRRLPSGRYRETFSAANLPSGVYFYKLQTSERSIIKKMLLLR